MKIKFNNAIIDIKKLYFKSNLIENVINYCNKNNNNNIIPININYPVEYVDILKLLAKENKNYQTYNIISKISIIYIPKEIAIYLDYMDMEIISLRLKLSLLETLDIGWQHIYKDKIFKDKKIDYIIFESNIKKKGYVKEWIISNIIYFFKMLAKCNEKIMCNIENTMKILYQNFKKITVESILNWYINVRISTLYLHDTKSIKKIKKVPKIIKIIKIYKIFVKEFYQDIIEELKKYKIIIDLVILKLLLDKSNKLNDKNHEILNRIYSEKIFRYRIKIKSHVFFTIHLDNEQLFSEIEISKKKIKNTENICTCNKKIICMCIDLEKCIEYLIKKYTV